MGLDIAVLVQAPSAEEGPEQSSPVIEALGLKAAEQHKSNTGVLLRVQQSDQTRLGDQLLGYLQVKQAGSFSFAQQSLSRPH